VPLDANLTAFSIETMYNRPKMFKPRMGNAKLDYCGFLPSCYPILSMAILTIVRKGGRVFTDR
jgi:hypothetical protein